MWFVLSRKKKAELAGNLFFSPPMAQWATNVFQSVSDYTVVSQLKVSIRQTIHYWVYAHGVSYKEGWDWFHTLYPKAVQSVLFFSSPTSQLLFSIFPLSGWLTASGLHPERLWLDCFLSLPSLIQFLPLKTGTQTTFCCSVPHISEKKNSDKTLPLVTSTVYCRALHVDLSPFQMLDLHVKSTSLQSGSVPLCGSSHYSHGEAAGSALCCAHCVLWAILYLVCHSCFFSLLALQSLIISTLIPF